MSHKEDSESRPTACKRQEQLSCLERFRPVEGPGKDTFQPIELLAGCAAAPAFQFCELSFMLAGFQGCRCLLSHFCTCKQPLTNTPITPLKLPVHLAGLCWYLFFGLTWTSYLGCIAFPWEKFYHPTYIYLTWHLLITYLISCSSPCPLF